MYDINLLEKIPQNPGVYLMKNISDEIMYVGKAKNLNKRVKQYFDKNLVEKRGPKIVKMVSMIEDIEYIVTETEVEALILENNLIKEYNPKYNTLLRDDKTYPYIKITTAEKFPRICITRKIEKDNNKYFGPFTDITALNKVIDLLKELFKLRYCDYAKLPKKECIYCQMDKCMAPCINKCDEIYKNNIEQIIKILSGNNKEINEYLNKKMLEASDNLLFEDAAKYRDLINYINKITLKQNINNDFDSQDIIAYEMVDNKAIVVIFFIRNGKMINRVHYFLDNAEKNEVLSSFIKQYYSNIVYFPNEIIIGENIDEYDIIKAWLNEKSNGIKLTITQKGHKNKLYELAKKNAKLIISEDLKKIEHKEEKFNKEILELKEITGLSNINKIESYDISNTSGILNVASMVVFEDGQFKKNAYRKFKLNVIGADDYACMKEVIHRRFTDEKMKFYPDILLIDGGKGQVNVVENVLKDLDIDISVCGMVKDDNHKTRGLYFKNKEYVLKKSLNLITRIQDETHNFAINYHSLLRTKEMLHSVLEDIEGIGQKKRILLMDYFGSIDKISNATKEELSKIKGLNKKDIENIYNFYKK